LIGVSESKDIWVFPHVPDTHGLALQSCYVVPCLLLVAELPRKISGVATSLHTR